MERRQWGRQLSADAAGLRLRARELARDVTAVAARIAQTEDDIARVRDALAENTPLLPDHA